MRIIFYVSNFKEISSEFLVQDIRMFADDTVISCWHIPSLNYLVKERGLTFSFLQKQIFFQNIVLAYFPYFIRQDRLMNYVCPSK